MSFCLSSAYRSLLVICVILLLHACDGGSSETVLPDSELNNDLENPVKLNVNVVKGPLAGATVNYYQVDLTSGDIGQLNRAITYFFEQLTSRNVSYQNGTLQFADSSDAEVYAEIANQVSQDSVIGLIERLKRDIERSTTVASALNSLKNYVSIESNTYYRNAVTDIETSYASLPDLKRRVADIPSLVSSLEHLKDESTSGDITFSAIINQVHSFSSTEQDSNKRLAWNALLSELDALRLSQTTLASLNNSLDEIYQRGEDEGWFDTDLVAERQLAALEQDVLNADTEFEAEDFITRALEYEGNASLKTALRLLRNEIINSRDAYELILQKAAFFQWSTTSQISNYAAISTFFSQFVTDVEQSLEPALRQALVNPEINPITNRPENWLATQLTGLNASATTFDFNNYEGLVYLEVDASQAKDISSGQTPAFTYLESLIHTSSIRGAGDNEKTDQATKLYLDGELLRFDDGSLVYNVSDTRLTPAQQRAYRDARPVFQSRSVSPLSTLTLQGGIHWALSDGRWVANSVLGENEQVGKHVFSSVDFNAYLDEFSDVIFTSFSGVPQSVERSRDVSLMFTEEAMFEPSYQRDIVRMRFVNEYISSLVEEIRGLTGKSTSSLITAFSQDLSDSEIDGLNNDQAISDLSAEPNVAAYSKLNPDQYKIAGTSRTLDEVIQVMRDEFTTILPSDYTLANLEFSDSEFVFAAPMGGVDSDGDGTLENSDAFPTDPTRSRDIPTDYDGIWALSVNEQAALPSRLNGTASFSLTVETVRGECISVPCVSIGDGALQIQDDWSVVSGPIDGDMVITEPNDSATVGFEVRASAPGLYTIQGRLVTAALPIQVYTFTQQVRVLDPSSFEYTIQPAVPTPGADADVFIQTTEDLCAAYSNCGGITVGDPVNVNTLGGDLVVSWQQGEEGLAGLVSHANVVQDVDYGQLWELYVRQLDTGFKFLIASVELGVELDSDGDKTVDRLDYFPGDGQCSARNDGFFLGEEIDQRLQAHLERFPESTEDKQSQLLSSGICFNTLISDFSLAAPYSNLSELGLELYFIKELGLIFTQNPAGSDHIGSWVLDPSLDLKHVVEDGPGKRIYLVTTDEDIHYIDLSTHEISKLVEPRDGYEIVTAPLAISEHLLVSYDDAVQDPTQPDIVVIYDNDGSGNELRFEVDNPYPSAGLEVKASLGGKTPINVDPGFELAWSLKRAQQGVTPTNYVEVENLRLGASGQSIDEGQTVRGDVIEVTLSHSGTDIATVFAPVIGIDGFQFQLRFPRINEDLVLIPFGPEASYPDLGDYVDVKWFLNGEQVDYFVEYVLSTEAPFMLSNTVTNFGDIVKAEIWFENGISRKLFDITTLVIGEPTDYVPVLDAAAVVTDRRVSVSLGSATTNDQFISEFFTPFWRTSKGDILNEYGSSLDTLSFDGDLPYGEPLLVGYYFEIDNVTGETGLLQIAGPDIDEATAVYQFSDDFYAPGNDISIEEDDFGTGELANYKGSWFVNGELELSNGDLSYTPQNGRFGDVITLFLEEEDADPGDGVDPVRFTESASTVLGYGFNGETDGDIDGDGVRNSADYFVFDPACYAKSDGRPDDFDMDGLSNLDELGVSSHNSYLRSEDSDGDGLSDSEEDALGTDPLNIDTDGDGNSDFYEARLASGLDPLNADANIETVVPAIDQDSDGLLDTDEVIQGTIANVKDTDGDGLEDGYEVHTANTDPLEPDSDFDGLSDGLEVLVTNTDPGLRDTDGDLISDGFEVANGYNPKEADSNTDQIDDTEDWPAQVDTDGDGLSDNYEDANGLNKADPGDFDVNDPANASRLNDVVGYSYKLKLGALANYRLADDYSPLPSGTCYGSWIARKGADHIVGTDVSQDVGTDQTLALAGMGLEQVFLYDPVNEQYLEPIPQKLINGTVNAITFAAGVNSKDTLFVGLVSGQIKRFDLSGPAPQFVASFDLGITDPVTALYDQGAYLVVEHTLSTGGFRQSLINKNAPVTVLHQFDSNESIAGAVWGDADKTRLWTLVEGDNPIFTAFDYDAVTPNLSGQIAPVNLNTGNLLLGGPIFIDNTSDFEAVRFASGELYYTATQLFEDASGANAKPFRLGQSLVQVIDDNGTPAIPTDDTVLSHGAYVNERNELELVHYPDSANTAEFWNYQVNLVDANVRALLPMQEDVVLVEELFSPAEVNDGQAYIEIKRFSVGDSDLDGLPGWYESYSRLDDEDSADAVLAKNELGGQTRLNLFNTFADISSFLVDSDGDGIGDAREDELFASSEAKYKSDSDFDGLTDAQELALNDLANFNPENSDSDADGILDGVEDADSDGLTNSDELNIYFTDPQTADTDADGVSDFFEITTLNTDPLVAATFDIDQDGIDDVDGSSDFDGDGLSNQEEEEEGTNPYMADTDGDRLSDFDEAKVYPSNALLADTDFDGISDYAEVNDPNLNPVDGTDSAADLDGDGLSNMREVEFGSDLNNADSDGDGLNDLYEVTVTPTRPYISSPLLADTDFDGLNDKQEEDGLAVNLTVNACDPNSEDGVISTPVTNWVSRPDQPDSDFDGLSDLIELDLDGGRQFLSNPLNPDTDGDGLNDFTEFDYEFEYDSNNFVALGFNPDSPPDVLASPTECDTDADGLRDLLEFSIESNIAERDTDNDFLYDIEEYFDDPATDLDNGVQIRNPDTDDDGLADGFEVYITKTSANSRDHDLNGVDDGEEDFDGDGLTNFQELTLTYTDPFAIDDADSWDVKNSGGSITSDIDISVKGVDVLRRRVWIWDGASITYNGSIDNSVGTEGDILDKDGNVLFPNNYLFVQAGDFVNDADEDADNDTISNRSELNLGTGPWRQDSDDDGVTDADEVFGNPGNNILPSNPLEQDSDRDGLDDLEEIAANTDPLNRDTDGDGLEDGDEVAKGLLPTNIDSDNDFVGDQEDPNGLEADIDGDGLPDVIEQYLGTDPNKLDSDSDDIPDGQEVWVFAYDAFGDLLRFGLDEDLDTVLDEVMNSRDGNGTWVPAELTDFAAPPFREVLTSITDAEGDSIGTVYVWYISNPSMDDTDGDSLSDSVELLHIENDVAGGLDLDLGIDLTAAPAVVDAFKTEVRFTVSNPMIIDTDRNNISDGLEDYDNDYLDNKSDSDLTAGAVVVADSDFDDSGNPILDDNLLDGVEVKVLGTSPGDIDSDGDGLNDGEELSVTFVSSDLALAAGTNPYTVTSLSDCPITEVPLAVAGVNYCFNVAYLSFPTEADSDADGHSDGDVVAPFDGAPDDYYPLDPGCFEQSDGFDDPARPECYSTWMADQAEAGNVVFIDDPVYQEVAIFGSDWDSVIRFDHSSAGSAFKPHVSTLDHRFVDYEYDSDRLYLVGESGELSAVNLINDSTILLPNLPVTGIVAFKAVASHLLVQEGEGASATLHLYDSGSNLIDSVAIPFVRLENAVWLAGEMKLFAYTNGAINDDILSITIDNGFVGAPSYAGGTWSSLSGRLTHDTKATPTERIIVPSGYAVSLDFASVLELSDNSYFGSNDRAPYQEVHTSDQSVNGNDETYLVASYLDESELGSADSLAEFNSVQVQVNADRASLSSGVRGDFVFPARQVADAVWGFAPREEGDDELFQIVKRKGAVVVEPVGTRDYDLDLMPCFFERRFNLIESANDDCGDELALGDEGQFADPDADGLTNFEEYKYLTNPRNSDSDEDGWDDVYEVDRMTDPRDPNDF